MSCSGCRVLRKGCSESCVLRNSIIFIDSSESQGYAIIFVAKFFGRAGMISSLSSVPESQRPALFRSLLYEACGRTVNPVTGSVGLLWSGKWDTCEAAVQTVLRGGVPTAVDSGYGDGLYGFDNVNNNHNNMKRERSMACDDLDLSLQSSKCRRKIRRAGTPFSDESEMTSEESTSCGGGDRFRFKKQPQLLNLFL